MPQNNNMINFDDIPRKTSIDNFGYAKGGFILENMPRFLAASGIKKLVNKIQECTERGKHFAVACGAHLIKVGCNLYIIDLIERGIIKSLHVNGAFLIHDWEIAAFGKTSENVDDNIQDGTFGWSEETLEFFSKVTDKNTFGLAEDIAADCINRKYKAFSVLAACNKMNIPVTAHVALGTDTIHMYDDFPWKHIGEACRIDFNRAYNVVKKLDGGLWLNIGSAVIMPEVLLKLVSKARNAGHKVENVMAANMDMINHYRCSQNVIGRPFEEGVSLIGHHEIMIPLLHNFATRCQ